MKDRGQGLIVSVQRTKIIQGNFINTRSQRSSLLCLARAAQSKFCATCLQNVVIIIEMVYHIMNKKLL